MGVQFFLATNSTTMSWLQHSIRKIRSHKIGAMPDGRLLYDDDKETLKTIVSCSVFLMPNRYDITMGKLFEKGCNFSM